MAAPIIIPVGVVGGDGGRAERLECGTKIMPGFSQAASTIHQKQEYASCVKMLHPKMGPADSVLMLAALLVVIGSAIFGGVKAWKSEKEWDMAVFGALLGFVGAILALMLVIGLIAAAIMLASGFRA